VPRRGDIYPTREVDFSPTEKAVWCSSVIDFTTSRPTCPIDLGSRPVHATGWHGGGDSDEPGGYGLKLTELERDRNFDRTWDHVLIDLDNGVTADVRISASFWRQCSELRSADIGRWLLSQGAAPWLRGSPPGVILTPVEANRFAARLLKRHSFTN
jgi:hypothetical protein